MLQAIKSDDDYSESVNRVWDLMVAEPAQDSDEYKELLYIADLLEAYDNEHYSNYVI